MPEDNMLYVINILQNLEKMSEDKESEKLNRPFLLSWIWKKDYQKISTLKKSCRRQERKSMTILVDTNIVLDALLKQIILWQETQKIIKNQG